MPVVISVVMGLLLGLNSASHAVDLPTSRRLQQVRIRVEPRIVADLERQGLTYGAPIFIRIFKESSELEVWLQARDRFTLFRTYAICTYSGGLGPKCRRAICRALKASTLSRRSR
jgi:murein L,D-transpeptidase YafK